ncbi:vacuolar protein sorting-associated protein 54, partial [Tachysurus ichikawai]
LVVHYIPIIRAHFETKLQPKQYSVLRHFDHITKDYNDHIAEISAKLVAIMDSLFEKGLFKLVVHYIPIIRAHFETKLQPKQYSVLRHFDHITKDYNDHIAEISAKLVAIMDSLFEKGLFK